MVGSRDVADIQKIVKILKAKIPDARQVVIEGGRPHGQYGKARRVQSSSTGISKGTNSMKDPLNRDVTPATGISGQHLAQVGAALSWRLR
jgi:hypothetical protein